MFFLENKNLDTVIQNEKRTEKTFKFEKTTVHEQYDRLHCILMCMALVFLLNISIILLFHGLGNEHHILLMGKYYNRTSIKTKGKRITVRQRLQ